MAHGYPSKSKIRSYFIKPFMMNKTTFRTGAKGVHWLLGAGMGVWVNVCAGAWVYAWVRGWVSGCVRGRVGVWVRVCLGACVCVCLCWCVCECVRGCVGVWLGLCIASVKSHKNPIKNHVGNKEQNTLPDPRVQTPPPKVVLKHPLKNPTQPTLEGRAAPQCACL